MAANPDIQPVLEFVDRVAGNIETVIFGKRQQVEYLLVALLCQGHMLIEDVPGTGKTMLARAAAVSMGLSFKRLQCTPDLLPNDVIGLSVYHQHSGAFVFYPGPVFVNILLTDEINRATPRTQSALLEAMQERQVTIEGETRPLATPFLVLATQNPIEYEGTFPLPEAQLDRFLIRISMGYASEEEELRMMRLLRKRHPIETIRPVVDGAVLATLHDTVADIQLDYSLERYIIALVRATRSHPDVALGASARGVLALCSTAQALAAVRGREYVVPDDIKGMAPLVLTHRLLIRPESQIRGRDAGTIVAEILDEVEVEIDERRRSPAVGER